MIEQVGTVEIKGREYTAERLMVDESTHPNLYKSMVSRGWEPADYLLTGKRGAQYNAYRSARTGRFEIVCKV